MSCSFTVYSRFQMDLLSFPPFYTLQPVLATREKQLELWRQVLMNSLGATTALIDLSTFPHFSNTAINRSLDLDSRRIIAEHLISSGFGEWEDVQAKTVLRVYSKTIEAWSSLVYDWAQSVGLCNAEISTFYEIHSGEDVEEGSPLQGLHPQVLLKALKHLESTGKVYLYPGSTLDEMGVKFQ